MFTHWTGNINMRGLRTIYRDLSNLIKAIERKTAYAAELTTAGKKNVNETELLNEMTKTTYHDNDINEKIKGDDNKKKKFRL